MKNQNPWYEAQDIIFYDPAFDHPDWQTAQLTSDFDVFWFKLRKSGEWIVYAFDYYDVEVVVRYCISDNQLKLQIYIPILPVEDTELEKFICSVYIANKEEMRDHNSLPFKTFRYNISDYLYQEMVFTKTDDDLFFGFYHSDDYM